MAQAPAGKTTNWQRFAPGTILDAQAGVEYEFPAQALDAGSYVTVSNYPGTTVEVSHATPRFDADAELFDTPGVLMLPSRSEDERVTLRALFAQAPKAVVQVGDAKNLKRTLALRHKEQTP